MEKMVLGWTVKGSGRVGFGTAELPKGVFEVKDPPVSVSRSVFSEDSLLY